VLILPCDSPDAQSTISRDELPSSAIDRGAGGSDAN